MATYYTSLFKKSDVRITTTFSSTHKGIDLSRGVVEQPIYLPNRAVSGYVWKILPGYNANGQYYANAPIIYIKHKDGSGSRYIHSYPKNVKVKVGDNVVAGQQICATGNSGYSFGDHIHFEWLTKWDDLNTRVDPTPYVISDDSIMKTGNNVTVSAETNVRTSPSVNGKVTGVALAGSVGKINDGPRSADGYEWWDVYFLDGGGWVANVGGNRLAVTSNSETNLDPTPPVIPPVTPPVTPPECPGLEECQKEVQRLQGIIDDVNEALGNSQAQLKLVQAVANENMQLASEVQSKYDALNVEFQRVEIEKNEAVAKVKEGLSGVSAGDMFAELWRRLTKSLDREA